MCSDAHYGGQSPGNTVVPEAHDCVKTNCDSAGQTSCGENVLWNTRFLSGADAIQQWLDSPGHFMNAMNPDYTLSGVGYYWCEATDQYHWVNLYA